MSAGTTKKQARYQQLLRAAIKVFARDGLDAASISDIAQVAGVAKGSVYLYFDSKEALSGDIVAHLFTFAEEGPSLAAEPRPLARILNFVGSLEARVKELGQDAPVVLHMFGHIGKTADDQLARGVRQLLAESRLMIELLLKNAIARGHMLSCTNPGTCAAGSLAMTFGVLHAQLSSPAGSPGAALAVAPSVRTYLAGCGADFAAEGC